MVDIKTEITVTYTPILNLSSKIRDLAAPYMLYGEARIESMGQAQERVIMIFEEEGYLIDCNWNRVAFAGQGGREGYQEENGPLRFFFEMVEKLEALNGFGKIKEVALDTWDIIETSDGAATDPAAFKKAYLSTHSYRAEGDLDDLAVTLVYKESSRTWEWRFGPFKQKADLDKHKLLVFPRRNIGDFETIKGILAHVKVTETGSSRANHKLYQSLCNNTREILSGIV